MELKDVKHLAMLARLDIPEDEQKALLGDLLSIIKYVDQVQNTKVPMLKEVVPEHHNSYREDVVTTVSGEYTEALIAQAVGEQDGFVKVKKIM